MGYKFFRLTSSHDSYIPNFPPSPPHLTASPHPLTTMLSCTTRVAHSPVSLSSRSGQTFRAFYAVSLSSPRFYKVCS